MSMNLSEKCANTCGKFTWLWNEDDHWSLVVWTRICLVLRWFGMHSSRCLHSAGLLSPWCVQEAYISVCVHAVSLMFSGLISLSSLPFVLGISLDPESIRSSQLRILAFFRTEASEGLSCVSFVSSGAYFLLSLLQFNAYGCVACTTCVQCPQKSGKGVESSGTDIADCQCYVGARNGTLEEQSVLLTLPWEMSHLPIPQIYFCIRIKITPMFLCSVLLYIFGVQKKLLKTKDKAQV